MKISFKFAQEIKLFPINNTELQICKDQGCNEIPYFIILSGKDGSGLSINDRMKIGCQAK